MPSPRSGLWRTNISCLLAFMNSAMLLIKMNHPTTMRTYAIHSLPVMSPSPRPRPSVTSCAWKLCELGSGGAAYPSGPPMLGASPGPLLILKPYWMSVTPRPASDPFLAACVEWRRYVRRKPTSWNAAEMIPFQINEKTEPTGRPSTKTSSNPPSPGARIVVSQYGGTASAAACSYV